MMVHGIDKHKLISMNSTCHTTGHSLSVFPFSRFNILSLSVSFIFQPLYFFTCPSSCQVSEHLNSFSSLTISTNHMFIRSSGAISKTSCLSISTGLYTVSEVDFFTYSCTSSGCQGLVHVVRCCHCDVQFLLKRDRSTAGVEL